MAATIILSNFVRAAQFHGLRASLVVDDQGNVTRGSSLQRNQHTWRVFLASYRSIVGGEKMDRIFQRYGLHEQGLVSGQPLTGRDIRLLMVGTGLILGSDIEKISQKSLDRMNQKELANAWNEASQLLPSSYFSESACSQRWCSKWTRSDIIDRDVQTIRLIAGMSTLSSDAWFERLAKQLASRDLEEGQLIPAPGPNGKVLFYQVYRKIAGNGLVAYALSPVGTDSHVLTPCLVFRPTQMNPCHLDAVEAYLNDVELYIGKLGYEHNKEVLADLMQDRRFCDPLSRLTVVGYSLAGAHGQRFLCDYPMRVAEARFYSDPSVESPLAEEFAKRMNQQPLHALPICIRVVRVAGDFVSYVGDKHVGCGVNHPHVRVQVSTYTPPCSSVLGPHLLSVFDHPDGSHLQQASYHSDPAQLMRELDNSQRGSSFFWYQRVHREWGRVLSFFLRGLMIAFRSVSAICKCRVLTSTRKRVVI